MPCGADIQPQEPLDARIRGMEGAVGDNNFFPKRDIETGQLPGKKE
jgi:hypothetical protein